MEENRNTLTIADYEGAIRVAQDEHSDALDALATASCREKHARNYLNQLLDRLAKAVGERDGKTASTP